MAKTKKAPLPGGTKMVDVVMPRSSANGEKQLYVSVNDYSAMIPLRGQTERVPDFVAEEINRALNAQYALDRHTDELIAAAQKTV